MRTPPYLDQDWFCCSGKGKCGAKPPSRGMVGKKYQYPARMRKQRLSAGNDGMRKEKGKCSYVCEMSSQMKTMF
jgi:hypothetical protein